MREEWNKIIEFNDKHFPNWGNKQLVYLSNALAGEAGEICNLVKHYIGGGTKRTFIDLNEFGFECFDALVYMVLLLENVGIGVDKFLEMFDYKLKVLYQRMEDKKQW